MTHEYPPSWCTLQHPWNRRELLLLIDELTSEDPCSLWEAERQQGAISDFEQGSHFLFDDVVLDFNAIGYSLFDQNEVGLIRRLKEPLATICRDLPNGSDEQAMGHPLWGEVRKRAAIAKDYMAER